MQKGVILRVLPEGCGGNRWQANYNQDGSLSGIKLDEDERAVLLSAYILYNRNRPASLGRTVVRQADLRNNTVKTFLDNEQFQGLVERFDQHMRLLSINPFKPIEQ